MKKYEFVCGNSGRIRALRDFGDVKAGDIGGCLRSEKNLSHEGDCWVYGDGYVYEGAVVRDNARLIDGAVKSSAVLKGDCVVTNGAYVLDNVVISGNAVVYGGELYDDITITDNASVNSPLMMIGNIIIGGDTVFNLVEDVGFYNDAFDSFFESGITIKTGMFSTSADFINSFPEYFV